MAAAEAKSALRAELRARRAALSEAAREAAGAALAGHAAALPGACVAAFVAVRSEPRTLPLLAAMRARGVRVLLPLLRADLDLEWAVYDGLASLAAGPRGLLEPTAASAGVDGLGPAALVLCPALAVGRDGSRLGQGGGSYDRALARTQAPVLAVVYDDEVLDRVPAEAHDRPVDGMLTPGAGVTWFASSNVRT